MEIENKDFNEQNLKELIEKVEKDDLPTNIFETEETDPLVLLGKLNEIIAKLKGLLSLINSSDSKSTNALNKAIEAVEKATTALTNSTNSLGISNTALDTATKAQAKAETADETAIMAVDEATQALSKANEAIDIANSALEQVTQGLGTKVYNNHNQIMNEAHFSGHNGINVDMDEEDPNTFNIRLDSTITQRIEKLEGNIVELTEMLSATEELADGAIQRIEFDANKPIINKLTYDGVGSQAGVEIYEYDLYIKEHYTYFDNHELKEGERSVIVGRFDAKHFRRDNENLLIKFTYPKDAVIFTMDKNFDPIEEYGGVWEELESGYTIQAIATTSEDKAGEKLHEGLPNLWGKVTLNPNNDSDNEYHNGEGVFSTEGTDKHYSDNTRNTHTTLYSFTFDAHSYNGIYGYYSDNRVQPKAITMYIWHKIS